MNILWCFFMPRVLYGRIYRMVIAFRYGVFTTIRRRWILCSFNKRIYISFSLPRSVSTVVLFVNRVYGYILRVICYIYNQQRWCLRYSSSCSLTLLRFFLLENYATIGSSSSTRGAELPPPPPTPPSLPNVCECRNAEWKNVRPVEWGCIHMPHILTRHSAGLHQVRHGRHMS